MIFNEFQEILSRDRVNRYLLAVGGNTKRSMTLYRANLKLTQELFTVESCFEITLRNKINQHYLHIKGNDWLLNSINPGGMFDTRSCRKTAIIIRSGLNHLQGAYSHTKLVAEMGLGFWRYMFANHQYTAGGNNLLQIFPNRPSGIHNAHLNQNFVFKKLEKINNLRDRMAHHEPICFRRNGQAIIDTTNTRLNYALIRQFFSWMNIDDNALLYGMDHVENLCNYIDTF